MFGYYDFDKEKFVPREIIRKAIHTCVELHCKDMGITPKEIDEDEFKSYLYDLVNYSDDFYEEIMYDVGSGISYR